MFKYFLLATSLLMFGCASYFYFTEKKSTLEEKPVEGRHFEKPSEKKVK